MRGVRHAGELLLLLELLERVGGVVVVEVVLVVLVVVHSLLRLRLHQTRSSEAVWAAHVRVVVMAVVAAVAVVVMMRGAKTGMVVVAG